MHVRHEPKPTSAKQQMKGTLRGGKPLGAPRGPSCSSSQLDAVCRGMGLARGCWTRCAGATRLPQPRTLRAGHARTAMGSPKTPNSEAGNPPRGSGMGICRRLGLHCRHTKDKEPSQGLNWECLTQPRSWLDPAAPCSAGDPGEQSWSRSRVGHRPGAQWLHRATGERPGGCTSAMAACQQIQTIAHSMDARTIKGKIAMFGE